MLCQIWSGFDLVGSKEISFDGDFHKYIYLSQLFSEEQIENSGIATLEFIFDGVPESEMQLLKKELFEAEIILRAKKSKSRSTVLYDLIGDKRPGHKYAPILHCAHTADVSENWDTRALLMNFRPAYLKSDQDSQKMNVFLKSKEGELLKTKTIDIKFNSTLTVSFAEEFKEFGGFKPGMQMNFKGGESQFAIFTLFWNSKSHSIGLEHSLPPIYYCKGILNPAHRGIFYQNAFRTEGRSI